MGRVTFPSVSTNRQQRSREDDEPRGDDQDPLAAPPPLPDDPVLPRHGPQPGRALELQGEDDPHTGRGQCPVLLLFLRGLAADQCPDVGDKFYSDLCPMFGDGSGSGRDCQAESDGRKKPAESLRSLRLLLSRLMSNLDLLILNKMFIRSSLRYKGTRHARHDWT